MRRSKVRKRVPGLPPVNYWPVSADWPVARPLSLLWCALRGLEAMMQTNIQYMYQLQGGNSVERSCWEDTSSGPEPGQVPSKAAEERCSAINIVVHLCSVEKQRAGWPEDWGTVGPRSSSYCCLIALLQDHGVSLKYVMNCDRAWVPRKPIECRWAYLGPRSRRVCWKAACE